MTRESLAVVIRTPTALKTFWDTIEPRVRTTIVASLFDRKEFIDKRTKIHRFDELLARRLNFRVVSVKAKPVQWRVDRLLEFAAQNPLVIHDVCHGYLKSSHGQLIEDLRLIGNDGGTDLPSNQYPTAWYLRVVDHLAGAAQPPIAAMCMYTLFSECPGRSEAFADPRYEALWQAHLDWADTQRLAPVVTLPNIDETPAIEGGVDEHAPVQSQAAPRVAPTVKRPIALLPPKLPDPPPPLPTTPQHFSPLDRLFMHAIHDSVALVRGALSEEDMARAIQELLSLNGGQAIYHFHYGYFAGATSARFVSTKHQSQDAQAWAFFGYLLGTYRESGDVVAEAVVNYQRYWEKVLVTLPAHDVMLLYATIPSLEARADYASIATLLSHCPIPQMQYAEHPDSVPHAIYEIAARLVRNGEHQIHADQILQALIRNCLTSNSMGDFYGRCLRKRGQLLRRKKQFKGAIELFELACTVPGFSEVAQCHTDIGLSAAGFPALDSIVPNDTNDFRVVHVALKQQRQYFDEALRMPNGEQTNAQFVSGIIAMGDGNYDVAYDFFNDAKSGMERQLVAYQTRGLFDWAMFLKIRTWSQKLQLSDIPTLMQDLHIVFVSTIFFPLRQWLTIYHNIARVDRDAGRAVMIHLFQYRDVDIFDLCNVAEVMQQPRDIWQRYFYGQKFIVLSRAEKLTLLLEAWHIAIERNHEESVEYILNLLEYHAEHYSEYAAQIDQVIVAAYETIVRIWGEAETLNLRIQLAFMAGKHDDAVTLIEQLLNIYLGQQSLHHARATLSILMQFPQSNAMQYATLLERPTREIKPRQCKVLYIGGNETQQGFKDQITEKLQQTHPHILVTWELIGWRSNWDKDAERIERSIPSYDLVILSPYVRTLFGRYIRKVADNWRPSTGKGQGKIYTDIISAVESFQQHEAATL